MKIKSKSLQPFIRFCMTIGEIPTSYMNSMTYEEQIIWLCNFLEKEVIPVVNNNSEVVKELQEWFENLDVQEEVNNKIEEMYESGQLQEIITAYLEINGVLGFNTIADMKQASNLINGSIVRTIGSLTYNDGKGNFYKIRTLTSEDVIDEVNIIALTNFDTLIAELIPNFYLQNLQEQINENYSTLDDKIEVVDDRVDATNTRIDNLNNKKYLFVGDSYGDGYTPDGMVTPWEDLVKEYLEIPDNKFVKITRGGAGFSTTLNITFNSIISELTDDEEITDIIICGGYNDMYPSCTESTITNGIVITKELCIQKFPNAKIHIGFIGNTSDINYKVNVASKIPFYIKACNSNNIHYLNNIEFALHNYYNDFSSDGIHPNLNGQKEIAYAVSQALLTGSADIQKPAIGLTNTLPAFITKLSNNIVTLELQSLLSGTFLNEPVSIICNGENYIEINTQITNGYIVGNNTNTACGYIHLIVLLSNNTYKDLTAKLQITGNRIRIYPMLINSNGTDYLTLSFKGYQIRPFTFVLPAINV